MPMAFDRRQAMIGGLAAAFCAPSLARADATALRIGAILPLAGNDLPETGANLSVPAEAARMGLMMARDDHQRDVPADGTAPELFLANAPEAGAIRRAAERLIEHDGVSVLIGGFAPRDLPVLADVARQSDSLFINIAAPADLALSNDCSDHLLHLESSARRYLVALIRQQSAGRASRWYLIHAENPDGLALRDTARSILAEEPKSQLIGISSVNADRSSLPSALSDAASSGADFALMLTDWHVQLQALELAEVARDRIALTGFPWAATQTRSFYNRSRQIAPMASSNARIALWEALATDPVAAALNADFLAKWRVPMDPSAWSAMIAFQLAARAAAATGGVKGTDLRAWLVRPDAIPRGGDSLYLTIDPVSGQITRPLFAVEVDPTASISAKPHAMLNWVRLLGEVAEPQLASLPVAPCGASAGRNGFNSLEKGS